MLLKPTATDGDFYVWTSPARPGQRRDYGLFGNAYSGLTSVDIGLAGGSFGSDSGNIHLVIGHNPSSNDEYITLWSKSFIRAADLSLQGERLSVPLLESEWVEGVATKDFNYSVNVRFVLENISEFGLSYHKPWNGRDDGALWFTNASISKP